MTIRNIISLTIAVFISVSATADTAIENFFLKVAVDTAGDSFTVNSKTGERPIVENAKFFHKIVSAAEESLNDPLWGAGRGMAVALADGSKVSLRLFDGNPFLHIHAKVHNSAKEPLAMRSLQLLDMGIPLDIGKTVSYGTGGLRKAEANGPGSYTFHVFADPDTRNGIVSASLSHDCSIGIFVPRQKNKRIALRCQLDFGNFQINPGETRSTDTIVLGYFDDARDGLEQYADAVAAYERVELKPKPSVYCTWYHARASDEEKIAKTAEFVEENLKPFGLNVIQIDDGWQSKVPKGFEHEGGIKTTGPVKVFVDAKGNYSKGMAHTAQKINSHGLTAGIWFMPFAGNFRNPYFDPEIFAKNPDGTPFHDSRWSGTCIDMSSPKAQAFVREMVERIHDWGYRYFKLDGMHTGMPSYNIYVNKSYKNDDFGKAQLHDPHTTHVQAYRKGLGIIRAAAPDVFVLGCNVSQNMRSMGPAFGLIDAMRIGPDNDAAASGRWNNVVLGARHGSNLYFLNGRIWHNDPDPIYVRASNPIEKARWMCSWLAVSGALHTSSEDYPALPPERLDLLKRTLPSHGLPARPVDLFETDNPRIWLVANDRLNLVGLFNWREHEPDRIVYDMGKLGLDDDVYYIGFDYWANEFVAAFKGELDQTLSPATSRVIALRPQTNHPQLLSTSRHITQGLMDVLSEKWDPASKSLSGSSAVVAGDLYELRIALPPDQKLKPMDASAEGAQIELGDIDHKGMRATIKSDQSRVVEWRVAFQ